MLSFGACVWAYITARFVDMVTNGDPASNDFHRKMDLINRFCKNNQSENVFYLICKMKQ